MNNEKLVVIEGFVKGPDKNINDYFEMLANIGEYYILHELHKNDLTIIYYVGCVKHTLTTLINDIDIEAYCKQREMVTEIFAHDFYEQTAEHLIFGDELSYEIEEMVTVKSNNFEEYNAHQAENPLSKEEYELLKYDVIEKAPSFVKVNNKYEWDYLFELDFLKEYYPKVENNEK